jgi:hypothetical protein
MRPRLHRREPASRRRSSLLATAAEPDRVAALRGIGAGCEWRPARRRRVVHRVGFVGCAASLGLLCWQPQPPALPSSCDWAFGQAAAPPQHPPPGMQPPGAGSVAGGVFGGGTSSVAAATDGAIASAHARSREGTNVFIARHRSVRRTARQPPDFGRSNGVRHVSKGRLLSERVKDCRSPTGDVPAEAPMRRGTSSGVWSTCIGHNVPTERGRM